MEKFKKFTRIARTNSLEDSPKTRKGTGENRMARLKR